MSVWEAVAAGASGNGRGAGGVGDAGSFGACLVVVYPPEPPLLGKRLEVPWRGFRIGGGADDFPLPDWDGAVAEVTTLPNGEEWCLTTISGEIEVNRARVDGSRALVNRDRIEIAGMGFVFLCGEDSEAQYHELTYRLTIVDEEIGYHNARYFGEVLGREVLRATRLQSPLSIAVLEFGSSRERTSLIRAMREVADRMAAAVQRDWVLARLTEHELGVVADTTEDELRASIERPFQSSKWPVPGQEQPVPRPRIGTATLSPGMTAEQLVEKARAASLQSA